MNHPIRYDHPSPLAFGGIEPPVDFDRARAVVLPIPFERTTSYVTGTRNAPREILLASGQVELWDQETGVDAWALGIHTLPEMDVSHAETPAALDEMRRVAGEVLDRGKLLVVLGGEHSVTVPVVEAVASRTPGLSVLQVDAHADLRDSYQGSRFSHACAMRRVLEQVPAVQVGIRSLSREESEAIPALPTRIFWDHAMRASGRWIDEVVESLSDNVYVTIDADGLDPAIMPAVGTPEPGGLSWPETVGLLKAVAERRKIVGFDVVELCPLPGLVGPNFLCAKLVYKLISYIWSGQRQGDAGAGCH
jgi:agmatinase